MYLTKAMQMAPNDVAVLNSNEKAITQYKRVVSNSSSNLIKFKIIMLIYLLFLFIFLNCCQTRRMNTKKLHLNNFNFHSKIKNLK
jgi:hypothetical protein